MIDIGEDPQRALSILEKADDAVVVWHGMNRDEQEALDELLKSMISQTRELTMNEDVEPVDEIQQALDRGFEPGRLWRVNDKEGNTLAETSSPKEFLFFGLLSRNDVDIYRQYNRFESEWVKEMPK